MDLINPSIQTYAEKHTTNEDALLKEVSAFTYATSREPHMLSGHLQGQLLSMISHMIRPRRILEIGTFTGYSALCLAKGLSEDGLLHTIEFKEEQAHQAKQFFDKSENATRIILHQGNALDIIPGIDETWDLVFIDADKPGYVEYFNLVLPKLRQNGFILADNVFFHGQVLEQNPTGKNAKAIESFNEYIRKRTDIERVMLTIRDGLFLIRKL